MSHTPGPWTVEPGHSNCNHANQTYGAICTTEGYILADVYADTEELTECAPANAQLIAAAPELLEALIDLGDWLAYGLNKADGAEPTAEDHAACERVAAKARAAIAKATLTNEFHHDPPRRIDGEIDPYLS